MMEACSREAFQVRGFMSIHCENSAGSMVSGNGPSSEKTIIHLIKEGVEISGQRDIAG